MQYRRMPGVETPLSVLGFGAMRLPKAPDGRIDRPAATAMVRHAIDAGVSYVDTAYVYHEGESEPFLGEALGDGYRERVRLATKLPGWLVGCREDMDRLLDEQRERLRTDVIDFYLLHGMTGEGFERLCGLGALDFLDDALADGRIRHAAFSFHDDYAAFVSIADAYDWTFAQVQYNYIDVAYQGGAGAVRYAAGKGLGVVVMEPLRGGALARPIPGAAELWARSGSDRTPAARGLAWLWDQPEVTVVLSGMSTMAQLEENLAAADRAEAGMLSPKERAVFDEVRELYAVRTAVGCTRCGYCQPCPSGVDIPECFGLYNEAHVYGDPAAARSRYHLFARYGGAAANCTECGQCEERCPQGLPIRKYLKAVTELLG
jgi:predicted aldo/keto reductase-like oxidoreductase